MTDFTVTAPAVYTRQKWADEWTPRPYLYAERATFKASAGGGIPSAVLTHYYGTIRQPGETAYAEVDRLEIGEHYVKIVDANEDGTSRGWVGKVVNSETQPADLSAAPKAAMQTFTCSGLELLLARSTISTAVLSDEAGAVGGNRLSRAPGFNMGEGRDATGDRTGNRSDTFGGVAKFGGTFDWSYWDVCKYLLKYLVLNDIQGESDFTIEIDGAEPSWLNGKIAPPTRQHGRSVKQVLDELFDRRRAMGWCLAFDPDTDTVTFKAFTYKYSDTKAADRYSITTAEHTSPRWSISTTTDYAARYDQVRVTSEPIDVVFSLEKDGGTLHGYWDSSNVDNGSIGAVTSDFNGYRFDLFDKRATEIDRLTLFGVPADWDGTYRGNAATQNYFGGTESFYRDGLEFLSRLPIEEGTDKRGVTKLTQKSKQVFGAIQTKKDDIASYELLHKLADQSDQGDIAEDFAAGGRKWAVRVSVVNGKPQVRLEIVGGATQTVLAGNVQNLSASDTDDLNNVAMISPPELDWRTAIVTVAMQLDAPAAANWPVVPSGAVSDGTRVKEIHAPGYHLTAVLAGTMLGVMNSGTNGDGENLTRATSLEWIRDDYAKLQRLAEDAWGWYGSDQHELKANVTGPPLAELSIGKMIVNNANPGGGDDTVSVRAPITSIEFAWPKKGMPTHRFRTQHLRLD